jgi:hypothetical protein
MIDRATANNPHHTVTFGWIVSTTLAIVLFTAVLLFGVLALMRLAHGWTGVLAEGAAVATPMAADGLVAFVSLLITGVGVVWLYVKRLAR